MTFRCQRCREYHRGKPQRRVGLGGLCADCADLGPEPSGIPPATRAEVLDRDSYSCQLCGAKRALHVHHIHYRSEGVDHTPDNLIVLCRAHHDLVHSNKRYWQPRLLARMASDP